MTPSNAPSPPRSNYGILPRNQLSPIFRAGSIIATTIRRPKLQKTDELLSDPSDEAPAGTEVLLTVGSK